MASFREQLRRAWAESVPDAPLRVPRAAAVALIVLERNESAEVLLIERARREGDPWSGHMALPGGHAEPHDVDLSATAERETLEEVGLDLRQSGERIGRLSDCQPMRGAALAVRPFVYLISGKPELSLSGEVRQALWVPILPLQTGQKRTTHTLERAGQRFEVPGWDIDGRVVWGLTYRVLAEFFQRLDPVSRAP